MNETKLNAIIVRLDNAKDECDRALRDRAHLLPDELAALEAARDGLASLSGSIYLRTCRAGQRHNQPGYCARCSTALLRAEGPLCTVCACSP